MILPMIGLNGTPKAHLVQALLEAKFALDIAINKLQNAAPNGRDYITNSDFIKAHNQHNAWVTGVLDIDIEINNLATAIDEIGGGRVLELIERIKHRMNESTVGEYAKISKLETSLENLIMENHEFLTELNEEIGPLCKPTPNTPPPALTPQAHSSKTARIGW